MKLKYWLAVIAAWSILIAGSAVWNADRLHNTQEEVYAETARSYFGLMVDIRQWNSDMGAVYVPVTPKLQPNPYSERPDRDIQLPDGRTLTTVNPAYMTRLVADITKEKDLLQFHITSLKPIRPENGANEWETRALTLFERKDNREYKNWDHRTGMYYYMAPLFMQQSCLPCHAQQGYQLGDIRGGISVIFPTKPIAYFPIYLSHALILLIGYVAIGFFGGKLSRAINRLEYLSHVDGLTKLHNRHYFDEYLRHEFMLTRRTHSPLSLILVDVDFFKRYNDTYGHPAGDDCLKQIARTLNDSIRRPADLAARYGGEEFVLILPDTSLEGAANLAEGVRKRIECLNIPHAANPPLDVVTISLGVWTYTGEPLECGALLQKVDLALYAAKQSGRNRVCLAPAENTTREKEAAVKLPVGSAKATSRDSSDS